jgi:O-succinylbenzoic acid--CoA ligase
VALLTPPLDLRTAAAEGVGPLYDRLATVLEGGGPDAVVVHTSGSTGVPKSVILSRDALIASATATARRVGEGRWLLALAPTTVAGLQVIVRSVLAGHAPAQVEGQFGAAAFVEAARRMPADAVPRRVSLVPAQVQTLLDEAGSPEVADALRGFATILVGGQSLPPETAARAADVGAHLVRTYGSTETCGGCVYDGIPLPGVRVRVEEGEVQIAGPVLADGYLGDPGLTARSFVRDAEGTRWYRTGDTGTVDTAVRVTGRLDNVIISGGVNVSLDLVEKVVRSLPGLGEAVVIPVPDPRWGQASVIVTSEKAVEIGRAHV